MKIKMFPKTKKVEVIKMKFMGKEILPFHCFHPDTVKKLKRTHPWAKSWERGKCDLCNKTVLKAVYT